MKRTHKFSALIDVAAIVRKAPSIAAAAKKLGVERSTIHRWIADGKVEKPGGAPREPKTGAGEAPNAVTDPSAWADWVRKTYPLDATAENLLDLAERALAVARDPKARGELQLAAMARYQQLVKQLNLDQEMAAVAPARPAARQIRVVGGRDPRAALMAAK